MLLKGLFYKRKEAACYIRRGEEGREERLKRVQELK
jgi:hypothetical protein